MWSKVEYCGEIWVMVRFYRGRRNLDGTNHLSQTIKPYILIPYMPHICQTIISRFGHYTFKTMVCQVFYEWICPKLSGIFWKIS